MIVFLVIRHGHVVAKTRRAVDTLLATVMSKNGDMEVKRFSATEIVSLINLIVCYFLFGFRSTSNPITINNGIPNEIPASTRLAINISRMWAAK